MNDPRPYTETFKVGALTVVIHYSNTLFHWEVRDHRNSLLKRGAHYNQEEAHNKAKRAALELDNECGPVS